MAEVKAASLGREDYSSRCGETSRMREAQEENTDVSVWTQMCQCGHKCVSVDTNVSVWTVQYTKIRVV